MACFIILIETCNGKLYQFNFRSFRKILNKSRNRSTLSVHYLGSNCNPLTIMNRTFLAGYIWVLNHRVIVLFYETVFTHSTIAWKEFAFGCFSGPFFSLIRILSIHWMKRRTNRRFYTITTYMWVTSRHHDILNF